ncbi:SGNH/GDSL hydrolase family protein [Kerstersia sp.]|uniref:SGNH/GDSL hydrolase family protein n=1 Tax=Kerstersia sp. TaxID=1930783 RepID=UPI003F8F8D34
MLPSILAGLSILIVGDSHMTAPNYLISSLHDDLQARGAVVHSIGVCGSNPGDWVQATPGTCGGGERQGTAAAQFQPGGAHTRPITELISQDKPDLVIVIMGDTMAGYEKTAFSRTWAWQNTTQLTRAIAATDTACLWVGPPWGTTGGKFNKSDARVQQVSSFLANNVAPCGYIDSLKLSQPGQWATVDGQHLTANGYRSWGAAIADAVLASPIVKDLKQ